MGEETNKAAEELTNRRELLKKTGATATLAAMGWAVLAMPPFRQKRAMAGQCPANNCESGCNSCKGCHGCMGTTVKCVGWESGPNESKGEADSAVV